MKDAACLPPECANLYVAVDAAALPQHGLLSRQLLLFECAQRNRVGGGLDLKRSLQENNRCQDEPYQMAAIPATGQGWWRLHATSGRAAGWLNRSWLATKTKTPALPHMQLIIRRFRLH
jgi:hypothetical protein